MPEYRQIPIPEELVHIPSPPKQLYACGNLKALLALPRVAVVGSRMPTHYGKTMTNRLAGELAEQGVVIISGLAFGIDSLAHQAALDVGGLTIAVLPFRLDAIVPSSHAALAEQILMNGGALVSEYGPDAIMYKQNYIARNRLIAGLSDVVLIPEAAEKSGSLYTARQGVEQGRTVMAVPGNVGQDKSIGTNNLLKGQGLIATNIDDVLLALGTQRHTTTIKQVKGRNRNEQILLNLMLERVTAGVELLEPSGINVSAYNQAMVMLEISGKIRPLGADNWTIR